MKKIFSISSVLLCTLFLSTACTNQTQNSSSAPSTQSSSSSDDISVEENFDKLFTKVDKLTKDNYKSDDYQIYQ